MTENIERDEVVENYDVDQTNETAPKEDNFLLRKSSVITGPTIIWKRKRPYEAGSLEKPEPIKEVEPKSEPKDFSIQIAPDKKLSRELADMLGVNYDNPCDGDPYMSIASYGRSQYFKCFVPENHFICKNGVFKIIQKKAQQGEIIDVPVRICRARVIPTGQFTSPDGTHIIELTFVNDDLKIETLAVPLSATLTSKQYDEIVRKNNYSSLAITGNEIKNVIEYFMDARKANLHVGGTAFKTGEVYTHTGWVDNDCTKFVIGDEVIYSEHGRVISKKIEFIDIKNTKTSELLDVKGELKEWIRVINEIIDNPNPVLLFKMYYDAATLALNYLGISNSSFGLVGNTSIGKTFTLQCSTSMFGNPHEKGGLIISGDISLTALNALLTTRLDIPASIDEITVMKEEVKKVVTYAIGNGSESLRGTKSGDLRSAGIIRTNVTMTGEVDIVAVKGNNGSKARSFTCNEKPLPKMDANKIDRIRDTICHNYGHVGRLLVRRFLENRDMVKPWYNEIITRLRDNVTDNVAKRKAAFFAAIEVGGILLESVFRDIGVLAHNPTEIVNKMWNICVLEKPDIPIGLIMANQIISLTIEKANNFIHSDTIPINQRDIYGYFNYRKNKNRANSTPDTLDMELEKARSYLHDERGWSESEVEAGELWWRINLITDCNQSPNGVEAIDGTKRIPYRKVKHATIPGNIENKTEMSVHRFNIATIQKYSEALKGGNDQLSLDSMPLSNEISEIIEDIIEESNEPHCTFDSPY